MLWLETKWNIDMKLSGSSTYVWKRRAKPVAIEASEAELILKANITRTIVNRIRTLAAKFSKAIQVC